METISQFIIQELKEQLLDRFLKSGAHVELPKALDGLTWEQAGKETENFPYTIWQLAEHVRITQYDIVEFCRNPKYESPDWPSGYWPKTSSPKDQQEWQKTVDSILQDRDTFGNRLKADDADLLRRLDHGNGQTLFNEALLILDHNAYHIGQVILIRKVNGWWD